jgi:hypothetical protein
MAITHFGTASNPADNGALSDGATRAVTPPSNMVVGDYVVLTATTLAATATVQVHSFGDAGGQSWTTETQVVSVDVGGVTLRSTLFHCRFNGTWSADPSIATSNASGNSMAVVMNVFRGVDLTTAIDVTAASAQFAAPGGSNDVTISAITTNTANALAFAMWHTFTLANTWTVQTGGWTQGTPAQVRATSGSPQSSSWAYKIQVGAGTTGAVVNRESGNTAGVSWILALKEAASGTSVTSERGIRGLNRGLMRGLR